MSLDLIFDHAIKCDLVDSAASDLAVVNSARISFDEEHPAMELGDDKLVNFLLRERHGSPFEHGYFKFRVEAPIFVFREHHRHRVGHSYNEMSGRYTQLEPHFYIPRTWREQVGKPGAYSYIDIENEERVDLADHRTREAYRVCWNTYLAHLSDGIAKEQARIVLPVGIFSKMIWSCNPRSLMHFLGLRAEKSAQYEIQVVARAAEKALAEHMPVTYESFNRNGRVAP